MNKCKDCKHYRANKVGNLGWGICNSPKVSLDYENGKNEPLLQAGGDIHDGYLIMSPEFGCILFDAK